MSKSPMGVVAKTLPDDRIDWAALNAAIQHVRVFGVDTLSSASGALVLRAAEAYLATMPKPIPRLVVKGSKADLPDKIDYALELKLAADIAKDMVEKGYTNVSVAWETIS